MDIECTHCSRRYTLSDDKIPADRPLAFDCPQCKRRIEVHPNDAKAETQGAIDKWVNPIADEAYDAADAPFDFVAPDQSTALICESDDSSRASFLAAVKQMGYHAKQASSARQALKKMRYHLFDLIVLDDVFDCDRPEDSAVRHYLNRLPIHVRRNIFVALVSERYRTMDNMAAFHQSVNMVVHRENLEDIEKILTAGLAEHERFYSVLKKAQVKYGKD